MKRVTLVGVSIARPKTIPTGILSIAAVLERAGYGVEVGNYAVRSYQALDPGVFRACFENGADIVGIGCMSDTLPFVVHALERFKKDHPDRIVVLGGPGPTGVARELLEAFPFLDIIVRGEGEITMLELVECLAGGDRADVAGVKGICCRCGKEVHVTGDRERIKNLDDLPLPLYDRVCMDEYALVNIVFSRGCPYLCTFCDVAPLWGRKHYRRSAGSVIEEIAYLKERFGKSDFEFTDETFVLKRPEVFEFCKGLRERRLEVRWSCTGRVNLVDVELLREMSASGCGGLFFGIESGSDAVLAAIRKDFTARDAVDALQRAAEYVTPVASFIWGFPFETVQDLTATLLLMVYLSQIGVDSRLNRLAPFTLAPLFAEYHERLIRVEGARSLAPWEPFEAAVLPPAAREIVEKYPRIFPEFSRFKTECYEEKLRIIASLDRYRHTVEWPECSAPANGKA